MSKQQLLRYKDSKQLKKGYHKLQVYRINVGQGDSGIVTFSQKISNKTQQIFAVLIDAGHYHHTNSNPYGKNLHLKIVYCLNQSKMFDMIVLSHLDADHIRGLFALLQRHLLCKQVEEILEQRQQIFDKLFSSKQLLSKQRNEFEQMINILNKYGRMIGANYNLTSIKTRGDTKDQFKKKKDQIDRYINQHILQANQLQREMFIGIDKNTKLVLPFPATQQQKKTLKSIMNLFNKVGNDIAIYGQDLWNQQTLHIQFPILKKYPIMSFISISHSKSPKKRQSTQSPDIQQNKNARSLITLFQFNGYRYLTCGDMPLKGMTQIANKIEKRVHFLQCPHHGAFNHINKQILNKLNPYAAFLSFGLNRAYKHPHLATINVLQGITVYCHCDPTQTNPAMQFVPEHVVVAGLQHNIYNQQQSPSQLQSDFKIIIKDKNNTAKVVYHKQQGDFLLVKQDKYGKIQPPDIRQGMISKQLLFKQNSDKYKIKKGLKTDCKGDIKITIDEQDDEKTVCLQDEDCLLTRKIYKLLDDQTYLVRWEQAIKINII